MFNAAETEEVIGEQIELRLENVDFAQTEDSANHQQNSKLKREIEPQIEEHNDEENINETKIEELLIDNTGKILKISNPEAEAILMNVQRNNSEPRNRFSADIQTHKLGRLDYTISKTLTGLMDLETVQKRLIDKDLVVKVINKKITNIGVKKSVSYLFGTMESDQNNRNYGQMDTSWTFKLDPKKHSDLAQNIDEECEFFLLLSLLFRLSFSSITYVWFSLPFVSCSHCFVSPVYFFHFPDPFTFQFSPSRSFVCSPVFPHQQVFILLTNFARYQ